MQNGGRDTAAAARAKESGRLSFRRIAWVLGPGLIAMLADTDAGNVVAAAQGGARWGYRLLPLVLALIPMLHMVQELTVRLGIFTRRGYGELIRETFGKGWAWLAVVGLAAATMNSLVTEFSAIAGIAELYGLPRLLALGMTVVALLAIAFTGSYRRVERITILIGLFELAFFVVAWTAHPNLHNIAREMVDLPFSDRRFLYLVAAIIGAAFSPWMIFYQQSAVADKRLLPSDYRIAQWDTLIGATLTQLLTGAVLIAVAAALRSDAPQANLHNIGEISLVLSPVLGESAGGIVFSLGVLGAAMVAAIVSSLALAWGVGEVAGYRRSLEYRPFDAVWFYGIYIAGLIGTAALVGSVKDLLGLNIAAQVLNVFLLPLVLGFLLLLARRALPEPLRPRGWYFALLLGIFALVSCLGLAGGLFGLG